MPLKSRRNKGGVGRENRESAVVACVWNGFRAQNFGRSSQLQNWCSGRDYSAAAGIMSGSRRANRKFRFFSEYMKELLRKIVYSASPYVRLSVRLRSFGLGPSSFAMCIVAPPPIPYHFPLYSSNHQVPFEFSSPISWRPTYPTLTKSRFPSLPNTRLALYSEIHKNCCFVLDSEFQFWCDTSYQETFFFNFFP